MSPMLVQKVLWVITIMLLSFKGQCDTSPLKVFSFPVVPYVDTTLPQDGVASEIVKRAFALGGMQVSIDITSINRAKAEAARAPVFPFVKNTERLQVWHFSEPVVISRTLLISHVSKPIRWKQLSDLSHYAIGITRGYSYGEQFDRESSKLQLDVSSSNSINLTKLIGQRIDAFPIEQHILGHLLKSFPSHDYRQLTVSDGPLVAEQGTNLACAKSHPQCLNWLAAFNAGLRLMKTSGEYQRILTRLDDCDPYKMLAKGSRQPGAAG